MKQRIGRFLAYINRARVHVATFNAALLLTVVLKQFSINIPWWGYPLLMIATLCVFILIGYIDTKTGFRKMEMLNNEENRPITMEIHKMIKEVHEKLTNETTDNNNPSDIP